jgi:SAM-dependent methyltransferase
MDSASRPEHSTPGTAATPNDGEVYGKDYFRTVYGVDNPRRFDMNWWSVRWYASLATHCLASTGGRRVLEIGCGHGFMLARLEQRYETWGIDISEYAIGQAARFAPRSRCRIANLEDELPAELPAGRFDLVIAKYVLEHLRDPGAALARAAALLRPGGMLLIAVPNTASLGARWKGDDWYARKDPTHCSLLGPARWREIVRGAGLTLSKESADGYWDLPYLRWLPTWLQYPFFLGPTALACLTGRAILPAGAGENLLLFARK